MDRIDANLRRSLLYQMIRIRLVEEEIAVRYDQGKMRCPVHLSIGQEAVAVAVGQVLRANDFAISTHRAHAHYLAKGGNLNAMISEIYGKATGCSSGRGGSMHLIDLAVGFQGSTAIVGGSIPVGVGFGLSFQLAKADQISCVFIGDGSIEEGVFYEAANFAALKSLPVLFICENNLYSVYSPLNVRQPTGRKIYEMVRNLGLEVEHGDGNDVEHVYRIVANAVDRIRSGGGPQFIELETYRWREHCGPNYDNDIGYRTPAEFEEWKIKDPIAMYTSELINRAEVSVESVTAMYETIRMEVAAAFSFAEESPFPDPEEAFKYLYKI